MPDSPPHTQPALSEKDWAKHIAGEARIKRMGEAEIGLGVYAMISSDPSIPARNDALNPEYGTAPPYLIIYWDTVNDAMAIHHPHRLAALALFQQAFGFTHEDVNLLEKLNATTNYTDGDRFGIIDEELTPDEIMRLRSLASRIRALLPPEGTRHDPTTKKPPSSVRWLSVLRP